MAECICVYRTCTHIYIFCTYIVCLTHWGLSICLPHTPACLQARPQGPLTEKYTFRQSETQDFLDICRYTNRECQIRVCINWPLYGPPGYEGCCMSCSRLSVLLISSCYRLPESQQYIIQVQNDNLREYTSTCLPIRQAGV